MRRALHLATGSLIYGVTAGPEVEDMRPYPDVATKFMREVNAGENAAYANVKIVRHSLVVCLEQRRAFLFRRRWWSER